MATKLPSALMYILVVFCRVFSLYVFPNSMSYPPLHLIRTFYANLIRDLCSYFHKHSGSSDSTLELTRNRPKCKLSLASL